MTDAMTTSNVVGFSLGPNLTAEEARAIYARGKEAVVFALLELAAQLRRSHGQCASVSSPATPSGMVPIYQKPNTPKRRKKPGQKAGHAGSRRPPPEEIHEHKEHRAPCCPHCQGRLIRCGQTRTRYTEDIPENIETVVTEHVIHRDWCPRCKKSVEPRVPDALPGSQIGNHVVALSGWLHYGLGQDAGPHCGGVQLPLALQADARRLGAAVVSAASGALPWYEQIYHEALDAAVLNADETGWRVGGKGHWLWCFTAPRLTCYLIDRRRGRPVVARFFRKAFRGTLVTDFWGPYNAVVCGARQVCLAHLLRDLEHVERYKSPSPQWPAFAKRLRRLLRDGIRLSRWKDRTLPEYASRRDRLHARLDGLMAAPWEDHQARRLLKRFRRHRNDLFTFLDNAAVPFDNNAAERAIRPAVIIRKNSYGNRSQRGADTQAVLMSIYRTLKTTRSRSPQDNHQRLGRVPEDRKTPQLAAVSTSIR